MRVRIPKQRRSRERKQRIMDTALALKLGKAAEQVLTNPLT